MTLSAVAAGSSASRPPRRLLLPPVVLALVAGAGTAALASWDPHVHHVPLCPLHAATGLWCPLCGSLRAVNDVTSLHWSAALSDNALLLVLAPAVALWWAGWLRRAATGRPGAPAARVPIRYRRTVWIAVVVLLVAYTVVRNLPFGAVLAPAG